MNPGMEKETASLPITPYLDTICMSLKTSPSHFLILTAETGAGKSTGIPPALLDYFPGHIIMLEPRRLAVLAIANRIAHSLGENPGQTVGYRMHLESCISGQTRLEIITEAVLIRKLQADPLLEDTNIVILDEFHERSGHTDLALAFLKETMQLRNDLYVIVMSATIDTGQLAAYLGTDAVPAPVVTVPGRQFPVTIEYAGTISPVQAIRNELSHPHANGTILVFLPGIKDIESCVTELKNTHTDADILILHSSISFSDQKKILDPPVQDKKRRIILSSAIAETSLSIPGVSVVIDSGLARINRMNIIAGMEQLGTEYESVFSAIQRTGRAGRTGPGACIRLWNKTDVRTTRTPPEILRTDLTQLVLECAQWGVYAPDKLKWLDTPASAAWNNAKELLITLGCIDYNDAEEKYHITPLGKATLTLGLHPRLACTVLAGLLYRKSDMAADTAGAIAQSVSCALQYSSYRNASPEIRKKLADDLSRRVKDCIPMLADYLYHKTVNTIHVSVTTGILLSGFPDRLARLRENTGLYQFPSGRFASLPAAIKQSSSGFSEWIIAPEADAGERTGKIYSFENICTADAENWLKNRVKKIIKTEFVEGTRKLRKTEYTCYGKIILLTKKLETESGDTAEAVCNAVETYGISWLPLTDKTKDFLLRVQFYIQQTNSGNHTFYIKPDPDSRNIEAQRIPDPSNLAENVREWFLPFLSKDNSITGQMVYEALYWYFDGKNIDRCVPCQLTIPNGKTYKLYYEKRTNTDNKPYVQPVLEIIIQQIFGCFETPHILGCPVLLKLLSPARRPLQITDDLAGFWQNTWPEVCREMKGRYPKHNWNYRTTEKC